MKKNTKVKCDVENCQHNDCHNCNLDVLDISCTCGGSNCSNTKETICKSFIKRN